MSAAATAPARVYYNRPESEKKEIATMKLYNSITAHIFQGTDAILDGLDLRFATDIRGGDQCGFLLVFRETTKGHRRIKEMVRGCKQLLAAHAVLAGTTQQGPIPIFEGIVPPYFPDDVLMQRYNKGGCTLHQALMDPDKYYLLLTFVGCDAAAVATQPLQAHRMRWCLDFAPKLVHMIASVYRDAGGKPLTDDEQIALAAFETSFDPPTRSRSL